MRISLIQPKWTQTYGEIAHFARKAAVFPPLNLCYLAAIAEQGGHQVEIIDGEAEELTNERIVSWLVQAEPDLVGITSTTPFHHLAVDLAQKLKQRAPQILIALGGAHFTAVGWRDLCFDYGFPGEAEKSWKYLLENWPVSPPLAFEPGPMDINDLPAPARHLLDSSLYNMGTQDGVKRFTSIMTMRGCPFQCVFCSRGVFGKNVRRRDIDGVIREMKACCLDYDIRHFFFLDDNLTLDRQYTLELSERIDCAGLDATWEGSTRANLVDEELIAMMARAGLTRLSFGLEAVDEGIRKTMKKNVPLEAYVEANRLCNEYGIEVINSCMIGLPGETEETVRKTLRFLRESKDIKRANVSIAVPYPGTELWEWAREVSHGLKLMTDDFSQFRRYNSAVMQVGDLTPQDLIEMQNEAYASIYVMAPWRWQSVLDKDGLEGAELTVKRMMKAIDGGKTRFLTDKQLGVGNGSES